MLRMTLSITGDFKYVMLCAIWYQFVQFRKREKHPWRSVTFSKNLQA